jgi:hypothetical protein
VIYLRPRVPQLLRFLPRRRGVLHHGHLNLPPHSLTAEVRLQPQDGMGLQLAVEELQPWCGKYLF